MNNQLNNKKVFNLGEISGSLQRNVFFSTKYWSTIFNIVMPVYKEKEKNRDGVEELDKYLNECSTPELKYNAKFDELLLKFKIIKFQINCLKNHILNMSPIKTYNFPIKRFIKCKITLKNFDSTTNHVDIKPEYTHTDIYPYLIKFKGITPATYQNYIEDYDNELGILFGAKHNTIMYICDVPSEISTCTPYILEFEHKLSEINNVLYMNYLLHYKKVEKAISYKKVVNAYLKTKESKTDWSRKYNSEISYRYNIAFIYLTLNQLSMLIYVDSKKITKINPLKNTSEANGGIEKRMGTKGRTSYVVQ